MNRLPDELIKQIERAQLAVAEAWLAAYRGQADECARALREARELLALAEAGC